MLGKTGLTSSAEKTAGNKQVLQRQCASCGNHATSCGTCVNCAKKRLPLQRQSIMSENVDSLEIEADNISHIITSESGSKHKPIYLHNISPALSSSSSAAEPVPDIVDRVLQSAGNPLEASLRQDLETKLDHDFSAIRVHTDTVAEQSADSINANAYTVGNHIVFGNAKFTPSSYIGKKLITHELVHSIQQSKGVEQIHRKLKDERRNEIANEAKNLYENGIKASPADFCKPYTSIEEARLKHLKLRNMFIPAERAVYGDEVAQLWNEYLTPSNSSRTKPHLINNPESEIVKGFVQSETTKQRQQQLTDLIIKNLTDNCSTLRQLKPNVATNLPINDYLTRDEIEFGIDYNHILEIAGNIAGGISSSNIGQDSRRVSGDMILIRSVNNDGRTESVHAQFLFKFEVHDAIDFCPGGMGSALEQQLTIPLSRFEATGLASDLPFIVQFTGDVVEKKLDSIKILDCYPELSPNRASSNEETNTAAKVKQERTSLQNEIPHATLAHSIDSAHRLVGLRSDHPENRNHQPPPESLVNDEMSDCLTNPLAYGRSLEKRYPGWLRKLPDCPCTNEVAESLSSEWLPEKTSLTTKIFHPGAEYNYRSAKGYSSLNGTSHGQQCTYDINGRLITSGEGAGTPDVWSPTTHFSEHQICDVQTWLRLRSQEYNKYWIPNKPSSCSDNDKSRKL